jgi:hypothetical protein
MAGSCRVRRPDSPGDLGALLPLDHADVILTLQVQPELRGAPWESKRSNRQTINAALYRLNAD